MKNKCICGKEIKKKNTSLCEECKKKYIGNSIPQSSINSRDWSMREYLK
jgi:hypothetical protein